MNPSGKDGPSLLAPLLSARDDPHANEPGAEVRLTGVIPMRTYFAVVAFTSVALYNVVELSCIIFKTFKRRSGLYFIAFCVATYGIPPYSIAYLVLGLHPDPGPYGIYGFVVLIVVGWSCTVTGQSMVLYSRLHLIDRDRKHLRAVLAMIITNGIILHGTVGALGFGANSSANPKPFYKPYSIIEKVQITVFFVQEVSLSALYIWATAKFFHDSALHTASTRARLLWHLIIVNCVVILIDITILGLEFADLYKLQTAYKAMAYSIKLKLEFSILSQLVNITREHASTSVSEEDSGARDASRWTWGANILGRAEPLTALNAVSTGDMQRRETHGSGKRNSWYGMGGCFDCRRRSLKGRISPSGGNAATRTAEISVSHDEEPQRRLGP